MSVTAIFCGCSYTQGFGLEKEKSDPNLWVNIVYSATPALAGTKLINAGFGGATNEDIFLSAIHNILNNHDCKYLFVAWTSLKRLHVNPGVELYDTSIYLENTTIQDVHLNPNITMSGKYVENIRDRFFDLTHPHYDLLKIFRYTSILDQMAKKLNIEVFFINSILPVDSNYFRHVLSEARLPTDTTLYTQELLNLNSRDNSEYFKLYDKIHQEYKETGALDCNWLNLDRGFRKYFYLDQSKDNLHPGIKSNQNFAHFLIEKLQHSKRIK